ncbi:hypothetical protein ACI65C_006809 [Semiaphis heraclei]
MLNILRNTGQKVPKDIRKILREHKAFRPISEIKYGPFIQELNHILTYGIQINDKQINFEVAHIMADAPAKAFLLNVKNHNGYFVCTSCEVDGEYLDRICFLDLSAWLRTDSSFRLKSNAEYHKDGFSPLIDLPIDITNYEKLGMQISYHPPPTAVRPAGRPTNDSKIPDLLTGTKSGNSRIEPFTVNSFRCRFLGGLHRRSDRRNSPACRASMLKTIFTVRDVDKKKSQVRNVAVHQCLFRSRGRRIGRTESRPVTGA